MSKIRVALATSSDYPNLTPDDLQCFPHYSSKGIEARPTIWSDPAVDWRSFDAVVLRTTWNYFQRFKEFTNWLKHIDSIPNLKGRIFNPVPTILRNSNKLYLKDLAQKGVTTLPTLWIERHKIAEVPTILENLKQLDWPEVVVKPAVSAGAFRTRRLPSKSLINDPGILHEIIADSEALIQPFAPEILSAGELSLMFFVDDFSHAVRKQPKAGDFRVQFVHGGKHFNANPDQKLIDTAKRIMRIIDETEPKRLFTRIDGIIQNGEFILMEIEMIEPYLFLSEDKNSPERFAEALRQRLKI